MPNVVCGAPRSHLLWPLLAVKRLVGRSHDPPMACAIARIRGSCTSPGHAGGGGGCSASNKRTRSSARAALGEVAGSRLGRLQAACCGRALGATSGVLAELRGQNKRAHLGHRREPGADWGRARCMPRGRGRRPRAVGRAGSMQLELRRQAWHSCARGRCEGLAFWHETPACGRLNLVRNLVDHALAFWHKTPAYGTPPISARISNALKFSRWAPLTLRALGRVLEKCGARLRKLGT